MDLLELRPGVAVATDARVMILVLAGLVRRSQAIGPPSAAKRAVLDALSGSTRAADTLPPEAADFVAALRDGGWLTVTVSHEDRKLYTILPEQPATAGPGIGADGVDDVRLSRFAVLRRDGAVFVLESPLANARIRIHDTRVLTTIGRLVLPALASGERLPPPVEKRLVGDLVRAGLAVLPGGEDAADFQQWRPHDLWFHTRSRTGSGGHDGGFGRTSWAKELADPPPSRPAAYPGPAVVLARPDLDRLRAEDLSLTAAVEDRRSRRRHDDRAPVTADQLGELLYRSARVRLAAVGDGAAIESRPYPAGGAAYELEIYPVVRLAAGLAPGMYHYEPHEHRLRTVRAAGPPVNRLLRFAADAAMVPTPPQVLLVVSARFGRLMRTYEEVPYSLILKHVGVLYQTLYLVATSMGLAACGLGAGDVRAFAAATGRDRLAESSVGDFMLGSPVGGHEQGGDHGSAPQP